MPILIDEVIAEVEAPAGRAPDAESSADAPGGRNGQDEQRVLRALRIAEERRQRLSVD